MFYIEFGNLLDDCRCHRIAFDSLEKFLAFLITNCGILLDDNGWNKALREHLPQHFSTIWVLFQEQVGEGRLVPHVHPEGVRDSRCFRYGYLYKKQSQLVFSIISSVTSSIISSLWAKPSQSPRQPEPMMTKPDYHQFEAIPCFESQRPSSLMQTSKLKPISRTPMYAVISLPAVGFFCFKEP